VEGIGRHGGEDEGGDGRGGVRSLCPRLSSLFLSPTFCSFLPLTPAVDQCVDGFHFRGVKVFAPPQIEGSPAHRPGEYRSRMRPIRSSLPVIVTTIRTPDMTPEFWTLLRYLCERTRDETLCRSIASIPSIALSEKLANLAGKPDRER